MYRASGDRKGPVVAPRRPPQREETEIEPLTPKQRARLRALAHELKPILQVGKGGPTPATLAAVREALAARELVKLKVLDVAPERPRETGESLVRQLGDAHLVQVIGRTLVLFRPDPENPRIELPA
ncbi:MAG: ribosome assembly RNA-binding protein YhbY [Gemmatimonadota bacterium]